MKNLKKIFIGIVCVTGVLALLLTGCVDDQPVDNPTTQSTGTPTEATTPDGLPEKEGVVRDEDKESTGNNGTQSGTQNGTQEEVIPDEGLDPLPGEGAEQLPDEEGELDPGVSGGEEAPPFYEGEIGEDTGDWGELH